MNKLRGFADTIYLAVIAAAILIGLGVFAFQASEIAKRDREIASTQVLLAGSRQELSEYVATAERQAAAAAEKARTAQAELQSAANQTKEAKDAQIQTLDAQLAVARRELLQRPARPTATASAATQAGAAAAAGEVQSCTGSGLYRDDALLLTGQADRARRLQLDYLELWDAYERARLQAAGEVKQ